MKGLFAAFVSGALFALGLGVSGMTNPAKIVGFLDLAGSWDASLALVMLSAVAVYAVLHRLVAKRTSPLFESRFHLPTRADLDGKLILGAAIFGVGWGLGGYCPGPGLVSLTSGSLPAAAFVLGMLVGMKLEHIVGFTKSARHIATRKVPRISCGL